MDALTRYGLDQDPEIRVELTGDGELYCFELELGSQRVKLHARSAVDLHHKLGKALLDWIGQSAGELVARQLAELGLE